MTVDEEFLQEMKKYIEEYHKMNGAPDKIARLLADFNVYYCRLIDVDSKISVVYKFKSVSSNVDIHMNKKYDNFTTKNK